MMSSLNFHCVKKRWKTLGDMLESLCGRGCTIVRERIFKYIEGMKKIILKKFPEG
jgi:hypothetical protein